jgi:hypothetical protein
VYYPCTPQEPGTGKWHARSACVQQQLGAAERRSRNAAPGVGKARGGATELIEDLNFIHRLIYTYYRNVVLPNTYRKMAHNRDTNVSRCSILSFHVKMASRRSREWTGDQRSLEAKITFRHARLHRPPEDFDIRVPSTMSCRSKD